MKTLILASVAAFALISCSEPAPEGQDAFFEALSGLCGQKYVAQVVEGNENDDTWRNSMIVMHVRDCSDQEIRIPLSVGEDASRTWIVTKEEGALTLKHDHRHEDGTPDEVSMYGGTSKGGLNLAPGNNAVFARKFPADQFSKDLFLENGLDVSVDNTWVMKIEPGTKFSYRLERPGRTFQIDFDLTAPVE